MSTVLTALIAFALAYFHTQTLERTLAFAKEQIKEIDSLMKIREDIHSMLKAYPRWVLTATVTNFGTYSVTCSGRAIMRVDTKSAKGISQEIIEIPIQSRNEKHEITPNTVKGREAIAMRFSSIDLVNSRTDWEQLCGLFE